MDTIKVALQQTLDEAFGAFGGGDLARTEAKCREVLGMAPRAHDAWNLMGATLHRGVLWPFVDHERAEANLRREAQARGVDPARLVFKPRLSFDAHLALHGLADLFLDTLPYSAHATAADALWCALPVLTTPGPTFAGRVAASALTSAGVPEMIAPDLAAYEETAVSLAADAKRLAAIRSKLEKRRSANPLFDTESHVRDLESAFETMWRRFLAGEAPDSFATQGAGR